MARENISMSALTAGLESARGRSTASGRENLMEGRTYIPRMSKEQKALLIAALQAGAKKRASKKAEKADKRAEKKADKRSDNKVPPPPPVTDDQLASAAASIESGEIFDPKRGPFYRSNKTDKNNTATSTGDNVKEESKPSSTTSTEDANTETPSNNEVQDGATQTETPRELIRGLAKGGKIPTYKKRTSKYRK
jgi:hypothetical protein